MASGETHFKSDIILAVATIPIGVMYPEVIPELIVGNIIGTLFSPDIDIEKTTYNEIILAKFINGKGAKTFITNVQKVITAPYAFFIPHRSWLSHAPFISTLTITLYLWLLYYSWGHLLDYDTKSYLYLVTEYQIGLATICLHHAQHCALDGFMITFRGKRVYLFGYWFYKLTTKLFPQVAYD